MSDALTDFKYWNVEWHKASPQVIDAILAQYLNRLETSHKDFEALDGKAKYGLTGVLGVSSILIAWAGKNIASFKVGAFPIAILITGFAIVAVCFTISLWPRPTAGTGVTPVGMKIDGWKAQIQGDEKIGLLQIKGQIICQYADNILCNEETIKAKGIWVRNGILFSVLTVTTASLALLYIKI